jgi:hypothetical protein
VEQLKVAAPRNIYLISLVKLAAARRETQTRRTNNKPYGEKKNYGRSDAATTRSVSDTSRKYSVIHFEVFVVYHTAVLNALMRRHLFSV